LGISLSTTLVSPRQGSGMTWVKRFEIDAAANGKR
jgi:hypothetical protein